MIGKPLERKASPIPWSNKKNSRVADSIKSAQMLAMDKASDDSILIAGTIHQNYTGRKILESCPLYDSIYSTRQEEGKTMRNITQIVKDAVIRGKVEKSIWADMKNKIADVLTKESNTTFLIMEILDNGVLNNDVYNSVPSKGVLNKDVFYGVKKILD